MERVYGPYPERNGRWRVVVIDARGERTTRLFASKARALSLRDAVRAQAAARTIEVALQTYLEWMAAEGRTTRTVETTRQRLCGLLGPALKAGVGLVTERWATDLYTIYSSRVAVDTHRNALGQCKTFWRWMARRHWVRTLVWDLVEGSGKRKRGKHQLRVDEARALWAVIADQFQDDRALAVGLALLLGLRASELVSLVPRDVDAGGTLLWVPGTKSAAAYRQLDVPPELRKPLLTRSGQQRILPYRREWVRDSAHWACRRAGVSMIGAHGLRGLHATLRVLWGSLSRDMGHSGSAAGAQVTLTSYLAPGTVERATAHNVSTAVLEGRSTFPQRFLDVTHESTHSISGDKK